MFLRYKMKTYEPSTKEITLCDYCREKILSYHDYIHIGETDHHIKCYGLSSENNSETGDKK